MYNLPLPLVRRLAVGFAAIALHVRPAAAQDVAGGGLHQHEPFVVLPAAIADLGDQLAWYLSAVAFFVLLTSVLVLYKRLVQRNRLKRIAILGVGRATPAFMMMDVLIHAIRKRGRVDPARLDRALQIARDLTEMDYADVHLREAARLADRVVTSLTFRWMRPRLDAQTRRRILEATVAVLLADGPLSPIDKAFLRKLTREIGMPRAELRDLHWVVPA